MKHILFIGMSLILLAACSAPPSPAPIPDTPTPAHTPTPAPTASPTPVVLGLNVQSELVNCRLGPGTAYVTVSELHEGQFTRALGRNDAATWLYVRDPGNPGGFCWLAMSVIELDGQAESLPVAPPPLVTVTGLTLAVEPTRILVQCSQFPQTVFFEAQVTANGPTLLSWQWEASTGAISDVGNLVFEEAGTKVLNEYYPINTPNDYWVKLHILTPNRMEEQVNFPVNCTQ